MSKKEMRCIASRKYRQRLKSNVVCWKKILEEIDNEIYSQKYNLFVSEGRR